MTAAAHNANAYLRTKVMTASPAQLRLMLFDGAIKFCRQARQAVVQKDFEGLYNSLTRAQKIVLELSTSLNAEADPDLCQRLASLYNYIYLRLVDANLERDETAIDESIRLLEYERETWALLMKKLEEESDTPAGDASTAASPAPVSAAAQSPMGHAEDPRPNPIGNVGPAGARLYTLPQPGATPAQPSRSTFTAQG